MPQVVYEGDGGDIVTAEEQRQRKSRYLKLKVSNCTQADLYWSCQLISVKRWMMPGNIELGASDCLLQSRACHVILLRLRLPHSQTTGLHADETAVHVDMEGARSAAALLVMLLRGGAGQGRQQI